MFARLTAASLAAAMAMTLPAVAQDRFGGLLAVGLARVIDARDAGANVAPPPAAPSVQETVPSDLAAVLSTKAITSATAR